MLCKEEDEPFNRENWIAEKKYDGSRVKIVIDDGIEKMVTRRGEEISHKFPEFEDVEVEGEYVLDGEVCRFPYTTKTGENNYEPLYHINKSNEKFNKLLFRTNQENEFKIDILSEKMPCKLVVFDVLKVNGEDLRHTELENRVGKLEMFIDKIKEGREHFIKPKQHTNALDLWQKVKDNNLEGLILKNLKSKYRGERSSEWRKVKNWEETTLEFQEYEEHNKGITMENEEGIRVSVLGNQSKGVAEKIDKNGSVEAEIQYLERTEAGKYRQPTFKRVVK